MLILHSGTNSTSELEPSSTSSNGDAPSADAGRGGSVEGASTSEESSPRSDSMGFYAEGSWVETTPREIPPRRPPRATVISAARTSLTGSYSTELDSAVEERSEEDSI